MTYRQETAALRLDELLTRDEVAAWLKLPVRRIYELPIPKVKLGRRTVRWRRADVEDFLNRRTME
jgi:predicted DNA-binding transcriptional regulator AlpA